MTARAPAGRIREKPGCRGRIRASRQARQAGAPRMQEWVLRARAKGTDTILLSREGCAALLCEEGFELHLELRVLVLVGVGEDVLL